jgi:hypothetical protein
LLAEKFFELFKGLDRAHGSSELRGHTNERGKVEAKSFIKKTPPTIELWEKHLAGEIGLGIFPLTDDAVCSWGTIDVDVYPVDHKKIEKAVKDLDLPLVLCTTKSQGAHLFLFCTAPTSAELVRTKLMEWAVALGYGGVEVFPKQVMLANDRDFGNWLNMPYFGTDQRKAMKGGKLISAEKFLLLADEKAVTAEELRAIELEQSDENLLDAPPCLQTLAMMGLPEGSRNKALFCFGVYARKRWGEDEIDEKIDDFNTLYFVPALGHNEVTKIAKSLKKKEYMYLCNEDPVVGVCNRQICISRKYGVGSDPGDPGIAVGAVQKLNTDPATWIVDVDGFRLETTSDVLMNQHKFRTLCVEKITKWPNELSRKDWNNLMKPKVEAADEIEAPYDATPAGLVMFHLEDFCTNRALAEEREGLLRAAPWISEGRVYFRTADFKRYLETQRVYGYDGRRLWNILKAQDAQHHQVNVKGKNVKCWSVPAFLEADDGSEERMEEPF